MFIRTDCRGLWPPSPRRQSSIIDDPDCGRLQNTEVIYPIIRLPKVQTTEAVISNDNFKDEVVPEDTNHLGGKAKNVSYVFSVWNLMTSNSMCVGLSY